MTGLEHDVIKTEINGYPVHKCMNPKCDLYGPENVVRKRAEETDCPYSLDVRTQLNEQ